MIKDPDGHNVEFVQYLPGSLHSRNFGKFLPNTRRIDVINHSLVNVHAVYLHRVRSRVTLKTRRTDAGVLKRKPRAQLDFAAGRRGIGDGSELRRVHKAVRRAEIGVIQGIEQLAANLEAPAFGEHEVAHQRDVQRLHAGP